MNSLELKFYLHFFIYFFYFIFLANVKTSINVFLDNTGATAGRKAMCQALAVHANVASRINSVDLLCLSWNLLTRRKI